MPWFGKDQMPLPSDHKLMCRCGKGFSIVDKNIDELLDRARYAGWSVFYDADKDEYELCCSCGEVLHIKKV